MKLFGVLLLFFVFITGVAYASGECCQSRSIIDAMTSDITGSSNFGLSLQSEYSNMKTIKDGSNGITHDTALENASENWSKMPMKGESFSIPTWMIMQKHSLLGTYSITDRINVLATVPYVINDMYMRKLTRNTMGMDMTMDMKMDTVEGLGDMTLMGIYQIYEDNHELPTKKLTGGIGLKTPTGKNDEKTDSGTLVHAMMQPGSGSWDPLFLVNYMQTFSPVVFQTNLLYQMTTEGDEGYEFGDKISLDLIGRYRVTEYFYPGLELNGFYAGQDTDHDGKYSRRDVSLLDNPDNTGITSLAITPAIQVKVPKTGCNIDLKFQQPLYQDVRGTQQVVDWRAMAAIMWAF